MEAVVEYNARVLSRDHRGFWKEQFNAICTLAPQLGIGQTRLTRKCLGIAVM